MCCYTKLAGSLCILGHSRQEQKQHSVHRDGCVRGSEGKNMFEKMCYIKLNICVGSSSTVKVH